MFESPFMDSILFSIPGTPLSLNWYGLSYLATFVFGLWYANRRAQKYPNMGWNKEINQDLLFYIMIGVIAGGRVGYVLFYNFSQFLDNPLYIIRVWEGGLSFHGGFLGVCIAYMLFSKKYKINPFTTADWVVPIVPMGVAFVRGGNTINAELWGRVTESPFGVYFTQLKENNVVDALGNIVRDPETGLALVELNVMRHPSTIYELVLEGVVLFVFLSWFIRKPRPRMAASGFFVLGYGIFRTFVESFRQPDVHLGNNGFLYGTDWITRGITLSVPMVIAGAVIVFLAYRKPIYDHERGAVPLSGENTNKSTSNKNNKKKGK